MDLYADLKEKVTTSGFTMAKVARKANVSTGTATHWANGRSTPNQSTYNRMIYALHELVKERETSMRNVGL